MTRVRDQQRICPHHGDMEPVKTQYGLRWTCMAAGCTVACWSNSTSTPADAETRKLRNDCHKLFDPLWKKGDLFAKPRLGGKWNRRKAAYAWLAEKMGIAYHNMHFGFFTKERCERALDIIEELIERSGIQQDKA